MDTIQLRIASLDCDIPVPNVYAERGFYSDIFEVLLRNAAKKELKNTVVDVKFKRYDCMLGELPLQDEMGSIDGIIITGSCERNLRPYSAYDNVLWIHNLIAFVRDVYHLYPTIKMFGSCFGHQLIAQSLFSNTIKSVVFRDPKGWEIGVHPITLTSSFLAHFGTVASHPSSPTELRLQFIHADHVVLLPVEIESAGFESIGCSEHCALQGLWKRGRVLTYQGHAEFDRFVNAETAKVFGKMTWDQDFAQQVVRAIDNSDDAMWAAGVMLKFFLEGVGKPREGIAG